MKSPRSVRHTSDGSGWTGFDLKSPAFGALAADICIRGEHATYQFSALGDVPTGNDGYWFNGSVQLHTDRSIRVLQLVGNAGSFVEKGPHVRADGASRRERPTCPSRRRKPSRTAHMSEPTAQAVEKTPQHGSIRGPRVDSTACAVGSGIACVNARAEDSTACAIDSDSARLNATCQRAVTK
jgi:hypothetical protein